MLKFVCDYNRVNSARKDLASHIFNACSECLEDFSSFDDERILNHKPKFYAFEEGDGVIKGIVGMQRNMDMHTISMLYTVPEYRKTGCARRAIGELKLVHEILHVTVLCRSPKFYDLSLFYESNGFLPAPETFKDAHGLMYQDYIWSRSGRRPKCMNGRLYVL